MGLLFQTKTLKWNQTTVAVSSAASKRFLTVSQSDCATWLAATTNKYMNARTVLMPCQATAAQTQTKGQKQIKRNDGLCLNVILANATRTPSSQTKA